MAKRKRGKERKKLSGLSDLVSVREIGPEEMKVLFSSGKWNYVGDPANKNKFMGGLVEFLNGKELAQDE